MSMERTSSGFKAFGDQDLADQFSHIQLKFAERHPEMGDIPLTGRLPGEISRLHPSLEGIARQEPLTIGGKTGKELLGELSGRGINVASYARSMVESPHFTTLPEPEQIEVILLQVRDLAIPKAYPTTRQIEAKRDELGLDPIPAEAAIHYLLTRGPQVELGKPLYMGMEPIADRYGYPRVFYLDRDGSGLWLRGNWSRPGSEWDPGSQIAFSLRKSPESLKP